MPIRQTTHVLKKSIIPSQTLPSSNVLQGEPLINIGDGILYFTGGTAGSPTWVQSDNPTPGYFEVGSNLYQLAIRDKIISYSGQTNLSGKFLSGSTNGFVLADISTINGISGFTYDPFSNTFTIIDSSGTQYPATINIMSGLTINGNLVVTGSTFLSGLTQYDETVSGTNPLEIINLDYLTGYSLANDVYVTGNTLTPATYYTNTQSLDLLYHGVPLNGPYSLGSLDTYTTGGTYDNNTALITFKRNDGASGYTVDLSGLDLNDTYVTGGTNNPATVNSPSATIDLLYNQDVSPATYFLPYSDVFLTGFTYLNNTFTLYDNSGNTFFQTVNSFTGLTINGDLTVTGNTNLQALTATTTNINGNLTVTGDTSLQSLSATSVFVSGFVPTQVVYVGPLGELTGENAFTYDQTGNTLSVDNVVVSNDVIIQGDLQVFGASISAFTSNLYVEDPNIYLNYNPTGSTTVTSVNAGFTIQDGNGVTSGDVNFDIVRMLNLTGLTNTEIPDVSEYVGQTGYVNRGWITQLNDIVIRSNDISDGGSAGDINGVRVLGEFDILDGGGY